MNAPTGATASPAVAARVRESLSDEDRVAWNAFWAASPHSHPRQHLEIAGTASARGRRLLHATAHVDGALRGIGVVSLGGTGSAEAVCTRGPAFDELAVGRALVEAIVERARDARVGRVRIAPHWLYPEAEPVEAMLAELGFAPAQDSARDDTGWIDLARPEDQIFASFTSSTRKEIRLADRRGVCVRPITESAEAERAWEVVAARRRLLRLSPVGRREFLDHFECAWRGRDTGVLLGALHGERLLGTLALLRSTRLAHPALYAVDPAAARELDNTNVGATLWWHAVLWARSRGCAHLDVEGNVLPLDPSHPRYEYENFKRRFAPEPRQRLAEHVLVVSPAIWTLHRHASRVASSWRGALSVASRATARARRGASRSRPLPAKTRSPR